MASEDVHPPMPGTRDRLLTNLKELADELDTVPRTVDMARYGDYDPVVYHEEFGSWDEAIEAAGLNPDGVSAPDEKPSGETDTEPTVNDEEETGYTHIAEARSEPTDAEEGMLEKLELFHDTYSHVPSEEDVEDTLWMPSPDEYDAAFGGVAEAAREAGIIDEEHHEANRTTDVDREELLDEVRKYRSLYGEVPDADDIDAKFWTHPVSEFLAEFGDWETVLEEAFPD